MGVPVRVAIVDDDSVACWALRAAIAGVEGLSVCTSPGSPADLTDAGVDVLIIAAREPRCPEIGTWAAASSVPVLVISSTEDPAHAVAGIAAGAAGYLTTEGGPEALAAAVQAVAAGCVCLAGSLARAIPTLAHGGVPAPPPPLADLLSPREREALLHIGDGLTHGQAARRMGVSKATVDTYIERVRSKLGVNNKAALVRHALRLSDPPEPVPRPGTATAADGNGSAPDDCGAPHRMARPVF